MNFLGMVALYQEKLFSQEKYPCPRGGASFRDCCGLGVRGRRVQVFVLPPKPRAPVLRCPPFGSQLAFGVWAGGVKEWRERSSIYYRSGCFFTLPFVFWNALSPPLPWFPSKLFFRDKHKNGSHLYMKPSLVFSLPQEPWWCAEVTMALLPGQVPHWKKKYTTTKRRFWLPFARGIC